MSVRDWWRRTIVGGVHTHDEDGIWHHDCQGCRDERAWSQ